ncbi:hypothetical protein A2U01_0092752, partial [Trifolium medium]|nr:hypothetical protein [Trifolium medium]
MSEPEQKSEPELKQKLKTKPDGDLVKMDFSEYDDSIEPYS